MDEPIKADEILSSLIPLQSSDKSPRIIPIFGEINEEISIETIMSLYSLKEEEDEPIRIIISSEGGNVDDMFAIYDVIRDIRNHIEVNTYGIGKVMSAAVLLLAAGSRGKRRLGKNCSVMLHSVSSGHFGSVAQIENEAKQVKITQKKYVDALLSETIIPPRKINNIMNKKTDYYLDSDKVLTMGIVDEIV